MATNGPVRDANSTDSTAFSRAPIQFHPTNVRDMIQRQVTHTVDKNVSAALDLSVGKLDGRFLNNYPGKAIAMQNAHGAFYHVIGMSLNGDVSVIAP